MSRQAAPSDEARWAGKIYGIPASVDDRALIDNKDLLVRAGLVDERGEAKPPAFGEDRLLAAAHQYQLRTDHHRKRPPPFDAPGETP